MTKEEILTECYLYQIGCKHNDYVRKNYLEAINNGELNFQLVAMDEYTKQEAIGFAEFIQENSYTKSKDKGWYQYYLKVENYPAGYSMSTPVYDFITAENLYNKYLEHLKQINK